MKFVMTQFVAASHQQVREFYSDVKNLKRISPPFPRLRIYADDTRVVQGREFSLTLDFILFEFRWQSKIDEVVEGKYFVDTFRGSVFNSWRHKHAYEPAAGGALLTDEIECEPAWWFAPFAFVGVKLLFAFRKEAIAKALG